MEAIVSFGWWTNENCHTSSKGIPISIAVLHLRVKSDESPTDLEMNLNNNMNLWLLHDPRNVGTHLNWREVVMWHNLTCGRSKA